MARAASDRSSHCRPCRDQSELLRSSQDRGQVKGKKLAEVPANPPTETDHAGATRLSNRLALEIVRGDGLVLVWVAYLTRTPEKAIHAAIRPSDYSGTCQEPRHAGVTWLGSLGRWTTR